VEAIWAGIATSDDWQPFNNKVKAIRRMGEAMLADQARSRDKRPGEIVERDARAS
jgi:hypothetical protein